MSEVIFDAGLERARVGTQARSFPIAGALATRTDERSLEKSAQMMPLCKAIDVSVQAFETRLQL